MINNYRGQEITWERLFEVLKDYLEGRREYSYYESKDSCRYRFGNRACLIGSFIPDDKYDAKMEGLSITSPIVEEKIKYAENLDLEILSSFQSVHDNLALSVVTDALWDYRDIEKKVPKEHRQQYLEIHEMLEKLNA